MTQSVATPEELAERIFNAAISAFDIFAIYLGDRLGLYRALADGTAVTSQELAERAGTNERYTREWLEQQAVTGILSCGNPEAPAAERRYALPAEYDALFLDPDHPMTMVPMAQIFIGAVTPLPQLLAAMKNGGGVPYEDYGDDLAEGQAGFTRPMFRHQLAEEWLVALPDIVARFQAEPPAKVADIGMGLGWSSIAFAQAFPGIQVDGFDLDEASVVAARANAEAEGVADRVHFHHRDAGDPDLSGDYDLAFAFECIHDMSDPVSVLAAMRRLVGPGGTVLIVDELAPEEFSAPGNDLDRYLYGFSILHCLPVGMVEEPSAATGTVIRESTMRDYARRAGFSTVEVLPIANDFYRFYRMTG